MATLLQDPRAYLQQRVALFTGASFAFFAVVTVADFAVSAPGEALFSSTRVSNVTIVLVNGTVWWLTRSRSLPTWGSRTGELFAVTVAMVAMATLPLHPPIAGVGAIMAMFGPTLMGTVLLLRAAIIPSEPWLSAGLGILWGTLMTASAVQGWEGVVLEAPALWEGQEPEPWRVPVSLGVVATVAFSYVAGVISYVVYGLESKVRQALEFGQYTIEAKLGEGGMGSVYRARHRMLRRPTAVKLLSPEKAGDHAVARFEREVQQTSRLTHPSIVAIYDYGRTQDGVFYYAMEYIEGIDLARLVREEGPLPQERVRRLVAQAAWALAEAHALGLVHRDVKPSNMMLCHRTGVLDHLKVVDFGLVKDLEREETAAAVTQDNTIVGTPHFLAPEAIRSPDAAGPPADVYGLGAVAYYLLTGQHVFPAQTLVEVCAMHLHEPPRSPSEVAPDPIDPRLEAIVLRCLAKAPEDRFRDGQALGAALEAFHLDDWSEDDAAAWWQDFHATEDDLESSAESQKQLAIDLAARVP
jgi:hypothetical protein